jgi:hypothetical protein
LKLQTFRYTLPLSVEDKAIILLFLDTVIQEPES